jgi:hypothetical protein
VKRFTLVGLSSLIHPMIHHRKNGFDLDSDVLAVCPGKNVIETETVLPLAEFSFNRKMSLNLVKMHLNMIRDTMRSWTNYNQAYQLYAYSLPIAWIQSAQQIN